MNLPADPVLQPPVSNVVDDAPGTLRMLCDALAIEGCTALVARNAAEALERFEMAVPDAVLLDAIMPGQNGFALCRQLKAEPAWAHVPVIFMTGLTEAEQIVEGFASGGVDYVVKPLKIPEVLARLATHLRNAHATRLAREAVDVAGLGVVLLDTQGRIAWRSPQATRWFEQALGEDTAQLKGWLQEAVRQGETLTALPDGSQLQARHLGQAGLGEIMILLRQTGPAADAAHKRISSAALTPRGGRSAVLAGQGKDQSRHRRHPGHEPAHGEQAPGTHLRETRGGNAHCGGGPCQRPASRPIANSNPPGFGIAGGAHPATMSP